MRRTVASILKSLECSTIADAENGSAALKMLEKGVAPVTFVLTELDMPVMNGIELLKQIRQSPKTKDLPVLIMTSEANRDVILAGAQAGADGFIIKPFTAMTIKKNIEKILTDRAKKK